jgi:hypothetical protein
MRSTLVSLVFVLTASTIAAFEHNYTQHNSSVTCKVGGYFDATQALLNDTLYQQVLDSTHQQDVQDWNYSTEIIFDWTEYTSCALVSYKAVMDSPIFLTFFAMSTRFPISVQKQVCLDGPMLIETVTVTAPLLERLNTTSTYHFHDDYVEVTSAFSALSPWYLKFLFDVPAYLHSAHSEQMDAVAQSFCSHLTTVKGLSIPEHKYLGASYLQAVLF